MKRTLLAFLLVPGLLLAAAQEAPVLRCALPDEGPGGVSHGINVVYFLTPNNATDDWFSVAQLRPYGTSWNASYVVNAPGPDGRSIETVGVVGADSEPGSVDTALRCGSRYQLRARTLRVEGDKLTDISDWSKVITCSTSNCTCPISSAADWQCQGCNQAAFQNLNGTRGTIPACHACVSKARDTAAVAGCHQCMQYKTPSMVQACLTCVGRGIAPWACHQYCAANTGSNAIMGTCTRCLATLQKAHQDLWGCQNCMAIAKGYGPRLQACVNCVDPVKSADAWSCGVCASRGNATAQAQCYDCLYANPGAAWKCTYPQ